MKTLRWPLIGLILLEAARVYFIMPFPGSQLDGEARAYPIQLIGYHHQVCDTVGGKPIMVTYCTVCRTGRVFDPVIKGQPETFRLVGMDHFNTIVAWPKTSTGTERASR